MGVWPEQNESEVCMGIRRAQDRDTEDVLKLLVQVDMVHHNGRPDLFRGPATKYTGEELIRIFRDDRKPVFVYTDEEDMHVLGYAFCVFQQEKESHVLTDIRTLYIDDLCVDEHYRGRHIGRSLYEHVLDFARENGCYNVTLNVWTCNESAMRFYERCGMKPQKIGMEKILSPDAAL